MPKSITVRVDDEVYEELVSRASMSGLTVESYLRIQFAELVRRPDSEELFARIRERKQRMNSRLSAGQILAFRDADRK